MFQSFLLVIFCLNEVRRREVLFIWDRNTTHTHEAQVYASCSNTKMFVRQLKLKALNWIIYCDHLFPMEPVTLVKQT